MKSIMKQVSKVGVPTFVAFALLLSVCLMMASCGTETIDNFNSAVACNHFCDKKFECLNADQSSDEHNACVSECRDSIENQCGNEHQADANDKIEECVDQDCGSFFVCMVFEAAPECLGFVNN